MFLKKLGLFNFKSHEELNLIMGKGLNMIVGLNGSGKTNILESIYYTCLTKSFSGLSDAQLIKENEPFFVVHLEIGGDQVTSTFKTGSKKQFLVNKIPCKKASEHIGKYPIVFVSPNDHDYIRDASDTRRRFFDELFCQTSKEYLDHLLSYNKLLKQRNSLLKQFRENNSYDSDLLEVFDEKIAPHNKWIFNYRENAVNAMSKEVCGFYSMISEESEVVSLSYKNDRSKGDFVQEAAILRSRDLQSCRTNFGIHKDDYEFEIEGKPIKKFGSQGQQKSFMLSTQLAKYKFLKENSGVTPFLLLDDVFDKLDHKRIIRLLEIIESDAVGQCFITDASKERSLKFVDFMTSKPTIFEINKGVVSKI